MQIAIKAYAKVNLSLEVLGSPVDGFHKVRTVIQAIDLADEIDKNPQHAKKIGINWCVKQCEDLLNHDIKNIHFYIMSGATGVTEVLKKLSR